MESLSTVVVENLSGCARTDYRSNHALLERAKFRRKLLNYKRGKLQFVGCHVRLISELFVCIL